MEPDFDLYEDDIAEGINLTPMVNLSLVLVMIFLVTSPYFVKDLVPVILPKAVSSQAEDQENITISISPTEGFSINEVPVLKKELARALDQVIENTGQPYVLIRADERVPHGEIEDTMKISKILGVRRIAFATLPKL